LRQLDAWAQELDGNLDAVEATPEAENDSYQRYAEARAEGNRKIFLEELGVVQIELGSIVAGANKLLEGISVDEQIEAFAEGGDLRGTLSGLMGKLVAQEAEIIALERSRQSLNSSLIISTADLMAVQMGAAYTRWSEKNNITCPGDAQLSLMHHGTVTPPDGWDAPTGFAIAESSPARDGYSVRSMEISLDGILIEEAASEAAAERKRIRAMMLFQEMVGYVNTGVLELSARAQTLEEEVSAYEIRQAQ